MSRNDHNLEPSPFLLKQVISLCQQVLRVLALIDCVQNKNKSPLQFAQHNVKCLPDVGEYIWFDVQGFTVCAC